MPVTLPDKDLKDYSCLTCRQRKVRCDRRAPCSNCIKAEKECSFIPPTRGKRKRTKPRKEGLHAKLKRYEDFLRSHGVKLETPEDASSDTDFEMESQHQAGMLVEVAIPQINNFPENEATKPKLITKEGVSRYFDSAPWSNLGDEHPEVGEMDGSGDGLNVFESAMFLEPEQESRFENLARLHPHHDILHKLREIFTDRVDPLIKILHFPTFWAALSNGLQHSRLSKSLEAGVFAFYLVTIGAMQEDECRDMFGAEKATIFSRYRHATRQALINARFLSTSSSMTLQAYAIFMMTVRKSYQSDTLFVLSGIALRLARKMGLHRDGTCLGLSPFEAEMRRRLWWHIAYVDFRTADVLGTRPSQDISFGDTKMPLNVDDEELHPEMEELPQACKGITSISLSIIKYEVMETLRKFSNDYPSDVRWEALLSSDVTLAKKDEVISEIEDRLERNYLRYCDPSNSLHTFISILIRSSICKMKLFAHTQRGFGNSNSSVKPSQSDLDIVFTNATKLLEYLTFMQGHRGLEKYKWQIGTSFLWNTLLYVLIEARHRKTGPEVDRSWQLIGSVFAHYPQIFEKSSDAVHIALGKWTLEVWDHYITACRDEGRAEPPVPEYIDAIRRCRRPEIVPESRAEVVDTAALDDSEDIRNQPQSQFQYFDVTLPDFEHVDNAHDFPDLLSFEMDPNEWEQWEQLVLKQSGLPQLDSM
ncbi:putative C6 transcription factor [Talaromyces proteolyticus]|uniref:C6 transcription factor n=1 Tax=Talaromyces proteolyticus TaxID=1131652 RepID=A0AAD4KW18_9EURO|nr:putative C6 transcription factor [Talaromyces proteolyticus]KAH8701041.1 putative C6 transcription factor [Talaromyces proteolyticus]